MNYVIGAAAIVAAAVAVVYLASYATKALVDEVGLDELLEPDLASGL